MRITLAATALLFATVTALAACTGDRTAQGEEQGGEVTPFPTQTPVPVEPAPDPAATPTPTPAPTIAMDIQAGDEFTCVLTSSGAVKCWGDNCEGQLGDGTFHDSSTPVQVLGLSSGAVAIAVGHDHACARKSNGAIVCWGDGDEGQLGDDTGDDASAPVPVLGLTSGALTVHAGADYTCAISAAGGVKCWGDNCDGQLGDGTHQNRHAPIDVLGLSSGFRIVKAWSDHTCALSTSGAARCWGENDDGELGDGTTQSSPAPVVVIGVP